MTPKEIHAYYRRMLEKPWAELCKGMQLISAIDFERYRESLRSKIASASSPDESDKIGNVFNVVSSIYNSKPIVSYTVKKELFEALEQSEPIDSSMLIRDAFALPYPTISILIEGDDHRDWVLFRSAEDSIIVHGWGGGFATKSDQELKSIPTLANSNFKPFIKILAYLTNNQDVITKKKKIEIPNESPSKTRKKKGRFLEVIEGEVGGIFAKNIKLFNEQQNTPGNNDEIDPVTGRKMKPHMRAGHWHTYRHGPGRTLTKLVFVHACAVNASEIAKGTTLMVDVK